MNAFKDRHFTGIIILWAVRWYWCHPSDLNDWHLDETYIKVKGKWVYLYRAVDSRGHTIEFYLSPRRNTKAAYRFLRKIFNRVKKWQNRKTLGYSKSPEMHDKIIGTFIEREHYL